LRAALRANAKVDDNIVMRNEEDDIFETLGNGKNFVLHYLLVST